MFELKAFLIFGGIGVQTQGSVLVMQVFYNLIHALSPFLLSYFCRSGVTFMPGASDRDPPTYASHRAGVIGTLHHT
jgi:hypothetical protein